MTRTCQNISHLVNQFYYYYWLSFWLCWEMMYELMICQDWVRYYSCSQGYQLQLIFHLFRPPFIVSGLQKMVFLLKIECTQKTWCEINNDEKLRLTINQSTGLVNLFKDSPGQKLHWNCIPDCKMNIQIICNIPMLSTYQEST